MLTKASFVQFLGKRKSGLFALASVVALVGFICLSIFLLSGTSRKEDSWENFQQGGPFIMQAPSGDSSGHLVVFASVCTGHGDIYVKKGAGRPVRLTDSLLFEASPVLTPDGKRIVFTREQGGWRHLWIMRIDGSDQVQLTTGKTHDDPLSFSADGRYLLLMRTEGSYLGQGKTVEMYCIKVDEVTSKPNRHRVGNYAVFMHEQNTVVFTENQEDLWSVNLDDPIPKKSRFPGRGWPIGFASNGRKLITGYRPRGAPWTLDHQILALDIERNIENQVAVGNSPTIIGNSGDQVLFFNGFDPNLYVASIVSGRLRSIVFPAGMKTSLRMSIDKRGALFALIHQGSVSEYDVLCVSEDTDRTTLITSVQCDGKAE